MRKLCFILAALAVLGAAAHLCVPASPAQSRSARQTLSTPQTLLPEHVGKWTGSSLGSAPEDDPWRSILPVLTEAGQKYTEGEAYKSEDRAFTVALRRFRDPSSAYEVYTALLTMDMHPSTVWGPSAISNGRLFLLIGDVILDIRDTQNASTEDLHELAKLMQAHSDHTPLPPIRTYLAQGFTDGTQRYALGPNGFRAALEALHRSEYSGIAEEVGFASGAEVMLAEYHRGRDSATLLVIEYPTPQLAEQHLHHLETVLPATANEASAKIERKGSLLTLVLAPTTAAYAEDLRSSLNYETQVTWNEPTHTITDPPWATVLGKIFIATGLFMVVAVVLGVAFGGVRLLTKIFLPGKVFDRPEQMDLLQLGLSGKKINSSDFY